MAKSLFNVVLKNGTFMNVLAQPDSTGKTALQVAIAAALATGSVGLQNAVELEGRPLDCTIAPAVAPATDATPKTVFRIQFRSGSGVGGVNVNPLLVLANPQTSGTVTTSANDLAIQEAATVTGAIPNCAVVVGSVDIDATV